MGQNYRGYPPTLGGGMSWEGAFQASSPQKQLSLPSAHDLEEEEHHQRARVVDIVELDYRHTR